MQDKELFTAIITANSIQDAIVILNENGYEINEQTLTDYIAKEEMETNAELTENELDKISGGSISGAIRILLDKLKGKQVNGQKQGSSGCWHTSSGRHG